MLILQGRFTRRETALVAFVAFVAFAFVAALMAVLAAAAEGAAGRAPTGAPEEIISVAEARGRPPGALVTVDGSVTVPPGAFKSGTSDEGFAIQDGTGGLYVRAAIDLGLRLRQRARVTGRVADSNGQLVLVPADDAQSVRARGRGMRVPAESVSTGRIGEATEGRLVRVTGAITKPVGNDLPYGYRLFINDGSGEVQAFVYASTGIGVGGLRPGQRIEVTGFSGQYEDHYEVMPRFRSDIRRVR